MFHLLQIVSNALRMYYSAFSLFFDYFIPERYFMRNIGGIRTQDGTAVAGRWGGSGGTVLSLFSLV